MRSLIIHAVYQLGKAHVGSVGETPGVDNLKRQTGRDNLHALEVLDGVEKRRGGREPQGAGVELFHRHRRLQKALLDFGSRHHDFL